MPVFGSPDLAIDIGTATTRVAGGRDGVCRRPSIARSIPALARGVIVDPAAAVEVLRPMLHAHRRSGLVRPRVLACAPTDVTGPERNAVQSCLREAGASAVLVVPEPLAAAVGAGIDIGCDYAKFLVDFGDGVTDCAVIRKGRIVASLAARVGCSDLRRHVQTFASRAGLCITDAEAVRILCRAGLARQGEVRCTGSAGGVTVEQALPLAELHAELRPTLRKMLAPIRALLRDLPASLGAEVIEDGIFLTGGGALLPGLREAVAARTHIETRLVADPLGAVIHGARTMLPFAATLKLWKS